MNNSFLTALDLLHHCQNSILYLSNIDQTIIGKISECLHTIKSLNIKMNSDSFSYLSKERQYLINIVYSLLNKINVL